MEAFKLRLCSMHGPESTMDPDSNIMKVYNVCSEMVVDRGFTIVDSVPTVDELYARIEGMEHVIVGECESKKIRLFFLLEERVPVRVVRQLMEDALDVSKTVIVSMDGPTSFTTKETVSLWSGRVQFLKYKDMYTNVTRHQCVPQHSLFKGERKYDDAHYPKILITDKVVEYYDFQVGDLVKIVRRFGVPEEREYLRLVCHPV